VTRFALLIFFLPTLALSQATFTTTGNWDNASNWTGSNIGDDVNENVTINNNRTAFIQTGFSYTIGNLSFGNSSGLTIDAAATLNVGDASNPRNLTANNSATITVTGTLIIWGDLVVNNSLTWNITGSVIIKGNIIMNNGASLSVSGNLTVDGNFTGGANTNVTITGGGGVSVGGIVDVGNNSNLTGPPGSFTAGGCAQGSGSSFCNNGVLPIELLYFNAVRAGTEIKITWATSKEEGFDYFVVQHSKNGEQYQDIGSLNGAGYNTASRIDYTFVHDQPLLGSNYYRLKAVDLDGTFEYFGPVVVIFDGPRSVSVYPNPVTEGYLNLGLNFNPGENARIVIMNSFGVSVVNYTNVGIHTRIELPTLSAGVYFVKFQSSGWNETRRFIVQ